jgi:putative oxidoreductase
MLWSSAVTLLRVAVGYVFMFTGISKWVMPEYTVHFAQMGIPWPEFTVLLVASTELICGSLLLFGLHTRKAVAPLILVMVAAIFIAKVPIIGKSGWWQFANDSRLDVLLLAVLLYLWIERPKLG